MSQGTHRESAESSTDDSATGSPDPSRRRKAWRPEADTEAASLLRRLAATPWLVGGRDDELIAAVRRNKDALRSAVARLGWVLVIERNLVRLRKSAPPRPSVWARQGPSPAACSWFFLLVAAAESMPPRTGLGQLVTAARSAAAEAALPQRGDLGERRAIVTALRMLDERGVVQRLDGDLDGYLHDEQAPVLLAIHHTRLAHVVANPGTVDPATDPQGWLEQVQREPDAARRMRRALVDDTCVHTALLDDTEAQWLSQRVRGDDGAPLATAFGLSLERRSEGAAFVVPDEAFRHLRELGPMPFPVPGTVAHAALLLIDHAAVHGTAGAGPGPGWRGMMQQDAVAALTQFADNKTSGKGGWGAEYTSDPVLLAQRVADLLTGTNLVHLAHVDHQIEAMAGPQWWFAPATGRWAEEGSAAPKATRSRTRSPATTTTAKPTPGKSRPDTQARQEPDLFSTLTNDQQEDKEQR